MILPRRVACGLLWRIDLLVVCSLIHSVFILSRSCRRSFAMVAGSSSVASFAIVSALSFPFIPTCPGTHNTSIVARLFSSRKVVAVCNQGPRASSNSLFNFTFLVESNTSPVAYSVAHRISTDARCRIISVILSTSEQRGAEEQGDDEISRVRQYEQNIVFVGGQTR